MIDPATGGRLVVIVTVGSRGDVQPYVALGAGLREAGFRVRLACPKGFGKLVTGSGLDYVAFDNLSNDLLESEEGQISTKPGVSLVRQLGAFRRLARNAEGFFDNVLAGTWDACRDADAIVVGPHCFGGPHIAERLGVPCFWALMYPVTTTATHPIFFVPPHWRLGTAFNRLSYFVARRFVWRLKGRLINRFRRRLDLPPLGYRGLWQRASATPVLYAYSSALIPRPTDWPDRAHVTGFWFLDQQLSWSPSDALIDFLRAGPRPLFIGLGGITARDRTRFEDVLFEALALAGLRAVVTGGWDYLQGRKLPPEVHRLSEVPFEWLFPRLLGAVHHGGAGTTALALRAGLPSLIIPGFIDQPFYADRVRAAGCGPRPRMAHQWTPVSLAGALRALAEDGGLRQRAEAMAAVLRQEDGVRNAVDLIARTLAIPAEGRVASDGSRRAT